MGDYWLGLCLEGYGIHGTNEPSSIGKALTQGCVRLADEPISWLYENLPLGTRVDIIYRPFQFQLTGTGLEVTTYVDIYDRYPDLGEKIQEAMMREGLPVKNINFSHIKSLVHSATQPSRARIPLQVALFWNEGTYLAGGYYYFDDVWFPRHELFPLLEVDAGLRRWYQHEGKNITSMIPLSTLETWGEKINFQWMQGIEKFWIAASFLHLEDIQGHDLLQNPLYKFQFGKVLQEIPILIHEGSSHIQGKPSFHGENFTNSDFAHVLQSVPVLLHESFHLVARETLLDKGFLSFIPQTVPETGIIAVHQGGNIIRRENITGKPADFSCDIRPGH